MAIFDFLRPALQRIREKLTSFRELGVYRATFSSFGSDIYKSETVRSCIRPLAEHTSKANAVSSNERIARILNVSPNRFMTGKDFLTKVRTRLEIQNTVFIFIVRDEAGRPSQFYPVPYSAWEALEYGNELFIRFSFSGGQREIVIPWADLAVIRKDYNLSDIAGDDNTPLFQPLDLLNTTNEGLANAVKATANLRGILKSTKAMLAPDAIKAQKDQFVKDYLNLENAGGIASIDSTQEFIPIKMDPVVTSWEQQKEFRENIYRYYGVSDSIVMSNFTEWQMEAFYDSRIEPFLVALSTELTRKCFTDRERAQGAYILYESNRMQYSSTTTKLAMVALVDRGALTPNEWRAMFNMAPVEGGDVPIRRLDTAQVDGPAGKDDDDE